MPQKKIQKPCPKCGVVSWIYPNAKHCEPCKRKKIAYKANIYGR